MLCVLALLVMTFVFVGKASMKEEQPAMQEASRALMSSTTIPYVTDTEHFNAYLEHAITTSGAQAAQEEIFDLYADAPYGEQHMAFHYLGEVLYEVMGTEAFPSCRDWYGFGCYHGFLLGAISTEGYEVVPSLDAACFKQHGHTMETETCQHGIGHGLLEFSGRDPLEAVAACDLVNDVYGKLGCASGVFMEYFAPTQSDVRSRVVLVPEFDTDDPLDVCNDLTGIRQATCLFEIHSWWADYIHLPPVAIESLCNSVENEEAREFCLIGYGNFKGPFVAKALPFCDEFIDAESNALCRAGVLWASEHHTGSPNPTSACTELDGEYEALCFEKGRFTCEVEGRCKVGE